jgi:hypothetical protein
MYLPMFFCNGPKPSGLVGLVVPIFGDCLVFSMTVGGFFVRMQFMTKLLKKAVERISVELSSSEHDQIAKHLIRLIDDEDAAWDAVFTKSPKKLRRLADEALEEHRSGRTELLDIEKL